MAVSNDLLRKWIAALRSGEYLQGRGTLRRGSQYCCLGVLCKVAGIPAELSPVAQTRDYNYQPTATTYWYFHGIADRLPAELSLPALPQYPGDLDVSTDGRLPFKDRDGYGLNLSGLNDSGMPFGQIADIIQWVFLSSTEAS